MQCTYITYGDEERSEGDFGLDPDRAGSQALFWPIAMCHVRCLHRRGCPPHLFLFSFLFPVIIVWLNILGVAECKAVDWSLRAHRTSHGFRRGFWEILFAFLWRFIWAQYNFSINKSIKRTSFLCRKLCNCYLGEEKSHGTKILDPWQPICLTILTNVPFNLCGKK